MALKTYASRTAALKRKEQYYPSEVLKKQLNEYAMQTGEFKSELAVRLLRSFFAAKKKEGQEPTVITLLPQK